ncbi:MAG TPA: NADH-quinone oxidoreductase subunit N, partial [Armatimonadota bacterium]|nr:NADH-quinone oxidoreductase subunit N [Armatimonadota bacterium]
LLASRGCEKTMPTNAALSPPGALDLLLISPELVLMGAGMVLLLVEMLAPRRTGLTGWLCVLALIGALACVFWGPHRHLAGLGDVPFFTRAVGSTAAITGFQGNVVLDGFALTMRYVVLVGSLLSALMGIRYAERFRNPGEFFALLLFATSAATLLTSASDLLMIYLTVEFLSISSYIMVGYLKFQPRSTEAAMKYFLYGAITAAVMLYGMSLLYGMSGTTSLYDVRGISDGVEGVVRPSFAAGLEAARSQPGGAGVILVAIVLMAVGFGFKIAMAPFHQWVPDVYDGSPLPVMAWLSVASKAAGMAVFVRVFVTVLPAEYWVFPVAVLAALTMTVGNLAALPQYNIKRMLAYSSVSHAGYTLMAVAALGAGGGVNPRTGELSQWQTYGVAVYLATYVFMNLGALAVVTAVYGKIKSHRIEDYAGLSQRAPGLAWLMVFFMLSLAGLPPTAGFWGKFVVFAAVIETTPKVNLVWLAVVGFINSVISVYYYWGIVRAMFLLKSPSDEEVRPAWELNLAVGLAAVATLGIFLFAGRFMELFGPG